MPEESLAKQTRNGFVWSAIENLSGQVISFVLGIILARLLDPSDFGVIGMLGIFMALSQSILDSGFGRALIQKKDRTQTDYSTVFYFNIVVSLVIYAILFIAAPFIADFYNMSILCPVTRVIAIQFIFNALQLVQTTKLSIELNFKTILKVKLTSNVLSGCVGIFLAYHGYGVWALVFQQIISNCLQTILLWLLSKWHPSLIFSFESLKRLFGFGSKLLITGLYGPIFSNMNSLIIGKLYSPAMLGFYARANSLVDIPVSTLQTVIGRVTFPVFSKIQEDDERLTHGYRMVIRQAYFIVFPMMLGICATAEPLVKVLLGDKWLDSVQYLRVLCFSGAFYQICAFNISLLLVKGRSGLHMRLDIIKQIVSLVILLICANISVLAICYGAIVNGLFSWIFTAYFSGKLMNLSVWKQIYDITPSFLISLAMMACVMCVGMLPLQPFVVLVLQILTGVIIYTILSYVFTRELFMNLVKMLHR